MEEVPAHINLFVLSRVEPPAVLARLRMCDHLAFVDWPQLQLTPEETVGIASTRLQTQRLSEQSLIQLHERAHGWVAGLVLLIEQSHERISGAGEIAAGQPLLFDYFAGEILQHSDPVVREFLLKTALLPKISVAAACTLTGVQHAQKILEDLARRNYFTVQHNGTTEVTFEYHPLFRGFLNARLVAETDVASLRQLRQQAASLLLSSGFEDGAIALFYSAGAWEDLAQCLCALAQPMLEQGRAQTLAGWIALIPAPEIERYPWVRYWNGRCLLFVDPTHAKRQFETAHQIFSSRTDRVGSLMAWSGIVEAIVLEFGELIRLDPWIDWLRRDLEVCPGFPSPAIEMQVTCMMAVALLFRWGRNDDVDLWFQRANAFLPHIPSVSARCGLAVFLSLEATWRGDLLRLRALSDNIDFWSKSTNAIASSPLDLQRALYVRAVYQWIAGVPPYGLKSALEALEVGRQGGVHVMDHHLVGVAVFAALCDGDVDGASKYLDQLKALSITSPIARIHEAQYHFLPGWLALLEGRLDSALSEAKNFLQSSQSAGQPIVHTAFSAIVAAYALIEMRRKEDAQIYVEVLSDVAKQLSSPIFDFSAQLLKLYRSSWAPKTSPTASELVILKSAFELGRRHNYMNTVVWYPAAMSRLCALALGAEIETAYTQSLIRQRGLLPPADGVVPDTWPYAIKVYTLGRFSLLLDDVVQEVSGKGAARPLELLKCLIAFGGRQVSQEKLIEALWPDTDGDSGDKAFHTTLYRLRKILQHDEAISLKDAKLSLDPRYMWVDTWSLERALTELEQAIKQHAPADHIEALTQPLSKLYKGLFLGTGTDEAWTLAYRERMQLRVMKIYVALSDYWQRENDHEKAIAMAERTLELDRLHEPSYQRLMQAYLKQGRQAEAAATYERCRKVLSTALGVMPSAKTLEIYKQIPVS
jgi:DNA-binding SARP family transcriptional activator